MKAEQEQKPEPKPRTRSAGYQLASEIEKLRKEIAKLKEREAKAAADLNDSRAKLEVATNSLANALKAFQEAL